MAKTKTNIEELAGAEVELPEYEAVVEEKAAAPKKAAASSELVVSIDDVAASKRRQDAQSMKRMINGMRKKLKESPKVKYRPSSGYAPIFGKAWTFLLNGFPITVRFDDSEQVFPDFVYFKILDKIAEGMRANAPRDVNEKIDK